MSLSEEILTDKMWKAYYIQNSWKENYRLLFQILPKVESKIIGR